jgi:hypothetical protein
VANTFMPPDNAPHWTDTLKLAKRILAPILAIALLTACGSSTDPEGAPAGHTRLIDGVSHAPGLTDPVQNCSECHGLTLEGGPSGEPSCFTCHGKIW